eukprot:COSAG02_NODE_22847_length_738_cov_35.754304_1_plen_55_part_01
MAPLRGTKESKPNTTSLKADSHVANANRRIIRVIRALFANIRPIRAPNECPPIRM